VPFDLAAIRDDVATTEAVYGPHAFLVRYRPSRYDDAFHQAFTEQSARESINYYLTELLVSWDLTSDGAPIPTTPEGVATVSLPIKLAVVKAVEADVLNPTITAGQTPPTSAPTATSSSGTPPAAPSATPNGPTAHPIGSGFAT
jgi:hypothetical protein